VESKENIVGDFPSASNSAMSTLPTIGIGACGDLPNAGDLPNGLRLRSVGSNEGHDEATVKVRESILCMLFACSVAAVSIFSGENTGGEGGNVIGGGSLLGILGLEAGALGTFALGKTGHDEAIIRVEELFLVLILIAVDFPSQGFPSWVIML